MKLTQILAALFTLVLLSTSALAFTGNVVAVADGDTVTVLDKHNRTTKVRLYGIDCPEKAQEFGTKAKEFTAKMVFGKSVEVEAIDTDRYGRTVGIINQGSTVLNEEIIKAGFAWVYTRYCKQSFCADWVQLQKAAQDARIGLWSHSNPQPPWEYRSGKRTSSKAKSSQVSTQSSKGPYHGNSKSRIFHDAGCRYFNCKNCTVIFEDRQSAVGSGFRPCKICKP